VVVHDALVVQVDILHKVVDSSYNHVTDVLHNVLVVVHLHELFQIDLVVVVPVLFHLETVPLFH